MEPIEFIINQILSIGLPEGVALGKEFFDQRKRFEQVKANLTQILQGEQSNWYYNDLTRVLTRSTILSDVLNGCLTGQPVPDIHTRIDDLLLHEQIDTSERSLLKGVIHKMVESITSATLAPANNAEARSAFRLNSIDSKITALAEKVESNHSNFPSQSSTELYLSEVESYCEPVLDVSHMIPRMLIHNTDTDLDENRLCWADILQANKRIAIINDAGIGKTYAMHQLHYAAQSKGYCSVYLSLNKYPGIPLFDMLLTKHLADSHKVVLVLDGYDEIKPKHVTQFISTIKNINDRLPNLTIAVSSRTNFFVHHPLEYELFRLADITEQEHAEYIRERGIDPNSFFEQVRLRGLEDVCDNAFYFVELVHLWQEYNNLPDEADIMEAIIGSRIRSDWEKYKIATPELSEHTAALRKLLERIAFIMQCTQQLNLTAAEIAQICTTHECDQLKLHGLWEDDASGSWTFAHNNFREYFAACWLRKQPMEQIVSYISWHPLRQKVKPSWMNVLAYMAKMKHSHDLQTWIAENDPAIITLFEKDSFSAEQRFTIFKRIYDQHEEDLTWADVDYDACKRMGAFASCQEAVEYVLDKLTKKLHLRQEKNLLRILSFFESLYGQEENCKLIISSIAFDDDYPDHTRVDALDVMRKFPQVFIDFVPVAAAKSLLSVSSDYRYHLQRFIEATGKLDEHFEIIIHELHQVAKAGDTYSISQKLFLEQLCSTVKSNDNVLQLFAFACECPECIDDSPLDEGWRNLFDVAITCSNSYKDKYLFAVLQLFSATQHSYYSGIDDLIKEYMVATKNEKAFLESIFSYEDFSISYAIHSLACTSLIDTLIDYYNADHLADSRILEQVIQRLSTDDPLHNKLVKAIYIKTGTEILLPHIVNNDDLRQGGKQQYFDALFSKPKFISLVEDLCSMFGRETPVKAHSLIFSESLEKKTALSQCLYTLRRTVGNKDEILLGTVIEQIKDWDWFQYFNASHAIRNENELSISNVQREWMENYTRNLLTEIDTVEIRKKFYDEHRVNQCLQLALTTAVRLNMSFPLEVLHTFVLIPSFLFGESNPTVFPEYLLDHIPEAEMSKLVLHNLQYEELREGMAAAHLNYCTDHKLYGAKDFAVAFLSKDESEGYRYSALNYISKLYSDNIIISEVLPLRDDARFLQDVAYHIPLRLSAPMLDRKLENILDQNPDSNLLELMIKRNLRRALVQYYEQAEKLHTLPDMTEGGWVPTLTEAIRYVYKLELIDIVIRLLRLSNEPGFVDIEAFGLSNSCWEAIRNMATENYEEVMLALTNEKNQSSGNHRLSCIDLLQHIDKHYHYHIDKGMKFELALALTAN